MSNGQKWAIMLGCWVFIQVLATLPASAWTGVPIIAAAFVMLCVLALTIRDAWREIHE